MAINVEKLRNYGIRIFKERNWKKLTRNYLGDGMSVRSLFFSDSGVFALMRQNPLRDNGMSDKAAGCLHTSRMITHSVQHSARVPISSRSFYGFCLIETRELRVLMSSVAKIVNKIYKTGINIEGLVNYFYQIAKNGENVLQFRR